MNQDCLAESLDREIEMLMTGAPEEGGGASELLEIAAELRLLPSEAFRQALRADLLENTEARLDVSPGVPELERIVSVNADLFASFSQRQFVAMPADPRNLLFSFLSHVAVVALIASGIWVGHETVLKTRILNSDLTPISLPPGIESHGGGGGGDRSIVHASRGTPPKFSDLQLTPPAIVVRNPTPRLQVEPTVLGPPQLKLPQSNQLGDLLSQNVVIPSNGIGKGGGLGDNSGTGDGPGDGAGVGIGKIAGFGGDVYRPGNGVSAPHAIYDPDPEYSDEARRAKFQGNVVLSLIVDSTGHVRDIHVARSVGMGLDEKAIEAVRNWRFKPGMRDGQAVAVQVNVEVNFRLY